MTLIVDRELFEENETVEFINRMIVSKKFINVTTSDKIIDDKVNIKMLDPEMLTNVTSKIDKEGLNIEITNNTHTIIILD